MKDYFLKLFAQEHWANQKLLAALKTASQVPPRTKDLCAHIFAAHEFMDKRLHAVPVNFEEYNFFPQYSFAECELLNEDFGKKWEEYLRALPEPLDRQSFSYIAPDGSARSGSVLDLLTHLHTHSFYHRGQIAVDLRAAGIDPVSTDYIIYCREANQKS